jgi:hypothetical protein
MNSDPTARQLNLYCDGELSPEECHRIDAQLAESPPLQAQVDFQRKLKQRLVAVLESGPAPSDLARRIREGNAADQAAAPRLPGGARAHRPWWRAPQRANVFAIGATLALVAGAVLVGIYGPSIDSWGGRTIIDATAEAAAAVAGEHASSTTDAATAERRWRCRTPAEAGEHLGPLLGTFGQVMDLRDVGYEFAGGSTCQVPHCEHGCHLFYRHIGDRPGMVSLHVVSDGPHIELRSSPDIPLPLPTELIPASAACRRDVLLWTHGRRFYLLVVCVPEDALPVARRMQEALRAAESRGP